MRAFLRHWLAVSTTLVGACATPQVRYAPTLAPAPLGRPVDATLYLVGDAGEINEHSTAVLAHMRENVASVGREAPERPVVVAVLGDNLYELGAHAQNEATDLAVLQVQADAVRAHPTARAVFIPGNHDWSDGGADDVGRRAVRLQQDWISRLGEPDRVALLPDDACPGPATLDVVPSVHLVFVDTEWLLRQPEDDCGDDDAFYERLASDLSANRSRRIVVLSHHPLESGGPHAGHVGLFERGPFFYYLVRRSGLSVQDLSSDRYSDMIERFGRAFDTAGVRPLFHAAGHDHSLQVIRLEGADRPAYQLVSGAGSRSTNSKRIDGTRYAANGYGYMRVDFHADGAYVTVFARGLTGGALRPVFACELSSADAADTCAEAPMAGDER